MINPKILEDVESRVEKEMEKLLSKPELAPNDWDAVKKAVCILNMMNSYMTGEPVDEEGMSYGRMMNYSDGRGRSPVTGRYVSRSHMNMGHGYSGHSVEDRMIMALEQQMDDVQSEYERQQIEKEIRRLRRGE